MTPRRPYHRPTLTVYGDVTTLTAQQNKGKGKGGKDKNKGKGKGKSN